MIVVCTETFQTHYKVFVVNVCLIFTKCPLPPVSWCNLWLLYPSLAAAFTKINSTLRSSAAVQKLSSAAARVLLRNVIACLMRHLNSTFS